MAWEIRPATVEDAAALAEIKVHTWRAAYAHILPEAFLRGLSLSAERAHWEQALSSLEADFRIATSGGEAVGYAVSGRAEDGPRALGELFALYVLPAHQGEGLGRALMETALKELRGRGFAEALLWVFEDNRAARAFYEAAGFRPDGRRRTEVGAPAVRYRRAL